VKFRYSEKKEKRIGMKERRKAQRLKELNEITISVTSEEKKILKNKLLHNYGKDISVSGAKIQSNILLPVDTLLKIDLTLERLRQKITALGKVKWVEFNTEDGSFEAGVEFVDTSSEAIQQIEEYILSKQKYTSLNPLGVPFWIFAKFNRAKLK
jgi:c-di-GMP-binding flagellar brake protein YcgR